MQETIHLSDLWEHTITKIFRHDPESELGIMIRQWVASIRRSRAKEQYQVLDCPIWNKLLLESATDLYWT